MFLEFLSLSSQIFLKELISLESDSNNNAQVIFIVDPANNTMY